MLDLANDLTGRPWMLTRSRGSSDIHQPSDLSDLQIGLTVQEKMRENPATGIVVSGGLQEREGGSQENHRVGVCFDFEIRPRSNQTSNVSPSMTIPP
jgi:hypothetical protein